MSGDERGGDRRQGILPEGTELNNSYRILRKIGQGGMGVVYEARELRSERRVAIKTIRPDLLSDEDALEQFDREAAALSDFSHDALVKYRGFPHDPVEDVHYLAMEFVSGRSLESLMDYGPLAADDVRKLLRRLASGLEAAHQLRRYHRDLAPDNVLAPYLPGQGGETGAVDLERAKIIDFGIVRDGHVGPGAGTIWGGFKGKKLYAAPEQFSELEDEIGPWTDVYSLGLVIAAALRGKPINMGGGHAEMVAKRRSVPNLDDIDPSLQPVLRRMLAPRRRDRFQDMRAVIDALGTGGPPPDGWLHGLLQRFEGLKGKRLSLPSLDGFDIPRRWLIVGGAAAAVLVLAAAVAPLVLVFGHAPRNSDEQDRGASPSPEPASVAMVRGLPSAELDALAPGQMATYGKLLKALAPLDCTWLRVRNQAGELLVSGGSARPDLVRAAVERAGGRVDTLRLLTTSFCPVLQTLKAGAASADDALYTATVKGKTPGISIGGLNGYAESYLFQLYGNEDPRAAISLTSDIDKADRDYTIQMGRLSGDKQTGFTLPVDSETEPAAFIVIATPSKEARIDELFRPVKGGGSTMPVTSADFARRLNAVSGWVAAVEFAGPSTGPAVSRH